MRKFSKAVSLILALALIFGSMTLAFAADEKSAAAGGVSGNNSGQKSDKIVILYTNDVHCSIDANIGYAGLAAYKNDKLAETDYVTLIDAGDAIQGEAIGTLSKGSYISDIMDFIGYDYAVPGNHEFDYGMDTFLNLAERAGYEYICCNFIDLKTGDTVFAPYAVETYGDTKVAYIGIDTPESFVKSTPTYFQDNNGNYIYDFCNDVSGNKLYDCVQSTIDQVTEKENADYVIAVGHLGIDEQSAPWTSREVIANTDGLDAFIDAHSHSTIASEIVKDKSGETVILTSTGTKLAAIGELVIDSGSITAKLITDYEEKDEETEAYIENIKTGYKDLLTRVVGKSEVELSINGADGQRAVRSAETNLGDFCADAYRMVLGADIAFVNGGGVRESIPAGDITYGQIIAVHPFGNMACVVEATGQEIADALEMASRSAPSENGGFLQVSGLTYTIDTDIPSSVTIDDKSMFTGVSGARRVKNITVGGEPIDLDKTYTLASHNYMIKSGGDGINMFMDNKLVQDEVMIDNQVLITYMEDYLSGNVGVEYKEPQGRITLAGSGLPFGDLKGYGWAKDAISYVYENKFFNGTSETTFAPAEKATRGMVVTVLERATAEDVITGAAIENNFADVKPGAYYEEAVLWAAGAGIAKGMGLRISPVSGEEKPYFAPNTPVTRQDLAAIILSYANAAGKGPVGEWMINIDFNDTDEISAYAMEGVAFCRISSIMRGYEDGSFKPKETVSRAELAVIMQNLAEFMAEK